MRIADQKCSLQENIGFLSQCPTFPVKTSLNCGPNIRCFTLYSNTTRQMSIHTMFVTLTSAAKVGDRDQVPTPHLVPWCQDNMRPLQLTAVKSSYGM